MNKKEAEAVLALWKKYQVKDDGVSKEASDQKIFVRISMAQGNVDEVEAFEIEPSITEEADEEWISGSKIFEVSLKKESNNG